MIHRDKGELLVQKFVKFYIILIAIFIGLGLLGFSITKDDKTPEELEAKTIKQTPGYATMIEISEMTKEQQLQDAVLDIQVQPDQNKDIALVKLQSSEFMSSDILLKDSYNMLQNIAQSKQIAEITFVWYQVIQNKNTEVLTMTFDRTALDQINNVSYTDLSSIATDFEQHSELQ